MSGSPTTSVNTPVTWTDCFGIRTISSGDWAGYKYVGEFKDDKRHGQGTQTFSAPHKGSGYKYVGEFRDNKKNGQGTATYSAPHKSAGQKYVGEYKDGKKHGQGTYTDANGNKYVGEWKDDKRHGHGTYTYGPKSKRAGNKYVGEWKDGKPNGQGTYTDTKGNKYVGETKDGKMHGQGILTFADGIVKEGIFENDKFKYAQKVSPTVTAKKSPEPSDGVQRGLTAVQSRDYATALQHLRPLAEQGMPLPSSIWVICTETD